MAALAYGAYVMYALFSLQSSLLQNYKHMGRAKFATIQCINFNDIVTKVTNLVSKVHTWYKTTTGEWKPFISAAHNV